MKVKIKKINEKAVTPFKTYAKDFCYDCVATSCVEVSPHVYKYGIGLAFEMDVNEKQQFEGYNYAIDFRPRSSVWKTGMVLSNCIGTVDELYRGEVSAVFYHVLPNMPKYKVGEKIIQCKLGVTEPIFFEIVDELNDTERGDKGYGSTGK